LEKPRSVFNPASLAFIGDSIYEVFFFTLHCELCVSSFCS
jgi:23S rRNA maturation mini-RNase III